MKRLAALALVLILGFGLGSLTACSGADRYRYPCQNPANFNNAECKSPVCDASDTCTSDLISKETTP